jgi:hypothetical protein
MMICGFAFNTGTPSEVSWREKEMFKLMELQHVVNSLQRPFSSPAN